MSLLVNNIIKPLDKSEVRELLLICFDNIEPITMSPLWEYNKGQIKQILYPLDNYNNLIFYHDEKKNVRCFEKESLTYLKNYNIQIHPVSYDFIPRELFDFDANNIVNDEISLEDLTLSIFQYFTKISIFIDSSWFLELDKKQLLKFNYEIRDFWMQNFTEYQQKKISNKDIFNKSNDELETYDLIKIQRYLLDQIKILLECEIEEYKYMINYIIVGALGLVIPEIEELYPDFSFSWKSD